MKYCLQLTLFTMLSIVSTFSFAAPPGEMSVQSPTIVASSTMLSSKLNQSLRTSLRAAPGKHKQPHRHIQKTTRNDKRILSDSPELARKPTLPGKAAQPGLPMPMYESQTVIHTTDNSAPIITDNQSLMAVRAQKENEIPPNFFAITFYKPTYLLPYYYTGSPDNKVYQNSTPENEQVKNSEIKYQLSFKVPVWKNIFGAPSTLYLAYTQLSYWQAYNHTAFFRETDYEPELFLANEVNMHLFGTWYVDFLNLGAEHQSNGFGGIMERSWNRVYLEAISSSDHFMVSIKPWYVIHDSAFNKYNPDLANYLGYGEILVAFKYGRQVVSIKTHSIFEMGGKRATGELTWSFPITSYLNGFLDVYSGYGQSLIEYNHRTNSAGVGIALSNWI